MTFDPRADLDAMFADVLGVDVVIGGTSGRGMLDEASSIELAESGLQVQGRVTTLLVRTDAFPRLQHGGAATVGGVAYTTREWQREDDGLLTRIQLARMST